jgi:hypothetical protein
MEYLWKRSCRLSGDPAIAGAELRRIEDETGDLTPAEVVRQSQADTAVLHSYFEWDDGKAGPLYRQEQARHLLRSIVVKIEREQSETPLIVRAFHPVSAVGDGEDEQGQSYVNTIRIWSEPALRQQVLARAMSELQALEKRYAEYSELAPVWGILREVRETLLAAKEVVTVG